ncbi:DUF1761 domain-containing protein [Agromyces subbeticus]|uniref:DUF1761 domain-containing protein n=1 Tax=Agromyces subbeticus TaxID=293890 RepID=UPI00047A9A85|nr:DUF1761 domain-containing protein [Agromyces subbeticus]
MITALSTINWLAVGLATIASFVLGALWFTPLFGRQWDRSLGIERRKGDRYPLLYYVVPLVSSLLMAIATAVLVDAIGIDGLADAALLGLVVGVGYSAAVTVTNAVTPVTPHPLMFALITGSYHVVGAVASAIIIVAMR